MKIILILEISLNFEENSIIRYVITHHVPYNFIGYIVFQISISRWQLKPWFSIHKFCFALWSETNLENSTAYVKNICYIIILLKYLWLQYYKIFICILSNCLCNRSNGPLSCQCWPLVLTRLDLYRAIADC